MFDIQRKLLRFIECNKSYKYFYGLGSLIGMLWRNPG